MSVTELGIVRDVMEVQLKNASFPMLFTEFGIAIVVREEHQANAMFPMLFTEFGIAIVVRAEHQANAYSPILVTELWMVMEVRTKHFSNALHSMLVYPSIISEVMTFTLSNPSSFTRLLVNTFSFCKFLLCRKTWTICCRCMNLSYCKTL